MMEMPMLKYARMLHLILSEVEFNMIEHPVKI